MGDEELEHPHLNEENEHVYSYVLIIRFTQEGSPYVDSFLDITDCLGEAYTAEVVRARLTGEPVSNARKEKGRMLYLMGLRARVNNAVTIKLSTEGFELTMQDADQYIQGLHSDGKLKAFLRDAQVHL